MAGLAQPWLNHLRCERLGTAEVAIAAIVVDAAQVGVGSRGVVRRRFVGVGRHGVVLMLVVADMVGDDIGLVPAVRGDARPDGLERHHRQQKADNPGTHCGAECIGV